MQERDERLSGFESQDATASGNVRIRVSAWLSGIVDEVRRKSPGPLQQWVDRVPGKPTDSSNISPRTIETETCSNVTDVSDKIQTTSEIVTDNQQHQLNVNSAVSEETVAENTSSKTDSHQEKPLGQQEQKKFWNKENFLNKFNKSVDKFNSSIADREADRSTYSATTSAFRSIGRAKINEFYEKVRINKARYSIIKSKKMDNNRSPGVASNCDVSDEEQYPIEHDDDDDSQNYRRMIKDDDEIDKEGIFEIDEQPSTSYHSSVADTSLGSIVDSIGQGNLSQPALKRSSVPSSFSKNINKLANIGRSVSENHPDDHDVICDVEDEDNFIPNERSRSYSQVISNNRTKAQRIINSQRGSGGGGGGGRGSDCGVDDGHNSDCNQVSSSLPSFFGNKSVPVSPILHTKGNTMSRETSLSEIPRRNLLLRDSSVQSDSSHCSSVESLLEARKPDPEQILINLGFGPLQSEDVLSKIPKRFLKPSQVRGVDTDCFLRQQQLANHLHDHSVLGYRGLVGNPHIPPSMIVAKIMERFEMNERNRCILDYNLNRPQSAPPTPGPNQ